MVCLVAARLGIIRPCSHAKLGSFVKKALRLLAVFASLAIAQTLCAAPLATVETVQAPAWLERSGTTQPLAPGQALASGDIVHTGKGARAYLLLAEGSRIKLGETASFALHSHSREPERALRGVLNVITGAFRFTTKALRTRSSGERDLAIRVGTATIGIRGTDIWGRSSRERDIVALLEGRIEVTRAGESKDLVEPMTYFDAPREGAPIIRPLESGQLSVWARETEILPGDGAQVSSAAWRVRIATVDEEKKALALYDYLREGGFAARIRPLLAADGSTWHYEMFIGGFSSLNEAANAAARITHLTGLAATAGQ